MGGEGGAGRAHTGRRAPTKLGDPHPHGSQQVAHQLRRSEGHGHRDLSVTPAAFRVWIPNRSANEFLASEPMWAIISDHTTMRHGLIGTRVWQLVSSSGNLCKPCLHAT